jgi:hypothetical protein
VEAPSTVEVNGRRAAALRITDLRVLALWASAGLLPSPALWLRQPRPAGTNSQSYRAIAHGKMTYDLPRLRLHGMIERVPKSQSLTSASVPLYSLPGCMPGSSPGLAEVLPKLPNAPPGDSNCKSNLPKSRPKSSAACAMPSLSLKT